jgi:hypothetical protein
MNLFVMICRLSLGYGAFLMLLRRRAVVPKGNQGFSKRDQMREFSGFCLSWPQGRREN